eukprot:CAMPEP_0181318748 /NCGR_PEP_ID=MMETSP1101-20121128/17177_1 /TAXON_ID=46948 /ORGANISM="Rhodomonas abbreviata, Strain Caron Lab Isolate" /LENGTH=78 /DNA_ID=CAMNT_0023426249 /DNA_START=23 /DNA_END=259 /DNA_ORIENTATION=+
MSQALCCCGGTTQHIPDEASYVFRFGILAERVFSKLTTDMEASGSEAHSNAAAWTAKADAILQAAAKKGDNSFYISNH